MSEQQSSVGDLIAGLVKASGIGGASDFDFEDIHRALAAIKMSDSSLAECCDRASETLDRLRAERDASCVFPYLAAVQSLLDALAPQPSRQWHAWRRLWAVVEAVDRFRKVDDDERWAALPDLLLEMDPVRSTVLELGAPVDSFDSLPALLDELTPRLKAHESAYRTAAAWEFRRSLEKRLQGYWPAFVGADERDAAGLYASAWTSMLSSPSGAVARGAAVQAGSGAALTARSLGIEEAADYAGDVERLLGYGLLNILPPAPPAERLASAADASLLLDRGMSRWYFCPYRGTFHPLDIVAAVVARGRPLYYERIFAHALVQFDVVRKHLSPALPEYLQILTSMQRHCGILLAAYSIGTDCKPRLKQPEGWIEYLQRTIDLHFGEGTPGDVARIQTVLADPVRQ